MPAVLITGVLFGVAHIGIAFRGGALEVLGVASITTLGGAFFSWLFVRGTTTCGFLSECIYS